SVLLILYFPSFFLFFFFFFCYGDHRDLHSFPTRRSSDLSGISHRVGGPPVERCRKCRAFLILWRYAVHLVADGLSSGAHAHNRLDRKSTRLNSSHDQISYAVFCLKKKKKKKKE